MTEPILDRRVHVLAELLYEVADALRRLAADLTPPTSFALLALCTELEEDVVAVLTEPMRADEAG